MKTKKQIYFSKFTLKLNKINVLIERYEKPNGFGVLSNVEIDSIMFFLFTTNVGEFSRSFSKGLQVYHLTNEIEYLVRYNYVKFIGHKTWSSQTDIIEAVISIGVVSPFS